MAMGKQQGLLTADLQNRIARFNAAVDRGIDEAVREDRLLRAVDRGHDQAVREDRALRAAARSEPRVPFVRSLDGLDSLRDPKRLKLDVWAEMEQMQKDGEGICGSQSSEKTNSQLERTKSEWFNVSEIQQPHFNRPFLFSDLGQKKAQWKEHQETLRRDFAMMRMDARPRPTKKRRTGGHEEKAPGGQEATPDK